MNFHDELPHPDRLDRGTRPHSGLGIASLAIAVVSCMIAVALVGFAGYLAASSPGGIDEESPVAILLGLGIFAVIGGSLLGGGIGVGGLLTTRTNPLFAVLGLMFNGFIVFGLVGLIVLGLAVR